MRRLALPPLVAALLIAALALTVGAYTVDANERERVQQTRLLLTDLARHLDPPGDDPQRACALDDSPQDLWGSTITCRPLDDGGFELASSGPDARPGTEDDILMRF